MEPHPYQEPTAPASFGWKVRLALLVCGMIPVSLLVVAFRLSPNSEGFGTHRQLGLQRCSFIEFIGIKCPACGMTTSWSHITKGQVVRSFQANCGGALLAIVSALFGPWAVISGTRGRWWPVEPNTFIVFHIVWPIAAVTILQWLIGLT